VLSLALSERFKAREQKRGKIRMDQVSNTSTEGHGTEVSQRTNIIIGISASSFLADH